MSRDSKSSGLWDWAKTMIYAVLIALVVRTVAFEPFNIPSGSMKPTLLVGDYLFVSKYSYGYSRYSLPLGLPIIPGRVLFTEPERGDVAVFKLPTDNKTDYIKRVVGLPGDKIQVRRGILHINDAPVRRELAGVELAVDGYGRPHRVTHYTETLPGGRRHSIYELSDNEPYDNTDVYTVPPGHYFMMGDNRDNSEDSRVIGAVGYVPRKNLVGRAEILFFSTDGSSPFWHVWRWPWVIRFHRFFQDIV